MSKRFLFPKKERLKSRKIIQALFKKGQSYAVYPLRLVWLKKTDTADDKPDIQITVSVSKRKFKKAVMRNRIKRQMREAWRLNKPTLKEENKTTYYCMLIYTAAETLPYKDIERSLQRLLRKWEARR